MTPRARRMIERRKQRQSEVWARLDEEAAKRRAQDLRKWPRPGWYPPTNEREYTRDEDLNPSTLISDLE